MNKSTHGHMISMLFQYSFFVANLMTVVAILVVLNAQFLWKKNVNFKLELVKNYNIKKKKKNPHRMREVHVMRLIISNIFSSKVKKSHIIKKLIFGYITQKTERQNFE